MLLRTFLFQSLRCIHTSNSLQSGANKQLLSKLRKATGYPFIKCGNALEKFNNDIEQAEKWLREEAQKEGWTKATKLQDRPMSQGLVGIVISDNVASMVEVNCETDFVARNVNFRTFVNTVANTLLQHGKDHNITKARLEQSQLAELRTDGKRIYDLTALEIGTLGENIMVRRGVLMKPENGQTMSAHVHAVGGHVEQQGESCLVGKYGALVISEEDPSAPVPCEEGEHNEEVQEEEKLTPEQLGKQLCQHVIGMNPTSLGSYDESKTEKKSGDEGNLLSQDFMFEDSMKVKDFLKLHRVKVVDFARLECGEELVVKKEVQELMQAAE